MSMNGFRVIDADGHGGEIAGWQKNIPAALQPQLEAWSARCKAHYSKLTIPGGGLSRKGDQYTSRSAVTRAEIRAGMFDPAERIKDMDLEGIDVTINFTGGAGEEWALLDRDFAIGLCRTLNDAKAEFNRHNPARFKGVAIVPMIDPQAAAVELRRAVTELGMVAMVTRQHVRNKNLDDPSFDVLWAEAERLDVPVCLHGGGQAPDQVPIAVDRFKTRLEVHAITHPFGNMIGLMCFTVGGILHRFPKLRLGLMESGCGWLPFWLERLDEHWERMPEQAPGIDRKPSEYFMDGRCFVGCDPDEQMIGLVVQAMGDRKIVYASDYYHWDCRFPDSARLIAERGDLSDANKRRILCENAAELYRL
jgi:uncharacterized protein